MILEEVDENTWGYMEAHGSFHGIYSWKLRLMNAREASTSTDSGKVHVFPWKLPLSCMEVNLLPPTSMEISMEVHIVPPTSMEASMEVNLLQWELPCGSKCSIEVNLLSSKLP